MLPGFNRFAIVEANYVAACVAVRHGVHTEEAADVHGRVRRLRFKAGLHVGWAIDRREMDAEDVRWLRDWAAEVIRRWRRQERGFETDTHTREQ